MYLHRGGRGRLPCDYRRGIATELYSYSWLLLPLTTLSIGSSPYLDVDPDDFSLLVEASELLDTRRYQCRVRVTGCGGACVPPNPQEFDGAEVTVRLIGMFVF